jgi:glycosyltransferase involved in cell wall biosynthesis
VSRPDTAPLRVLHVADKLAMGDSTVHGVTRCLALWVPRYDPAQFTVSVHNFGGMDPGAEYLAGLGVPVGGTRRGKMNPRLLGDLLTTVRRERVGLLHLHGYGATDIGRVVARLAGIPSIVHEHFIDQRSPVPERMADLALRPLTTWAIAVSGAVRDFMVRRRAIPPDRLEVVPNGAALEAMALAPPRGSPGALALRAELGIPPGHAVVAIVGRLNPIKGHTYFLRAAERVLRELPDVTFLVIGDGELDAELRAEARGLGLGERVIFTGYREDVPALLQATDILAITSLSEGSPLNLFEAMAAGCAVVATRVGGIPELLEPERTGLMVPPADPEAIAGAMLRLIRERELRHRLAEAARAVVSQRFDVRHTVRAFERRYAALVGRFRGDTGGDGPRSRSLTSA